MSALEELYLSIDRLDHSHTSKIQIELSGNDGSQEVLFLIDSIDQTTGNTQIVN
jgi:hypothetical protein